MKYYRYVWHRPWIYLIHLGSTIISTRFVLLGNETGWRVRLLLTAHPKLGLNVCFKYRFKVYLFNTYIINHIETELSNIMTRSTTFARRHRFWLWVNQAVNCWHSLLLIIWVCFCKDSLISLVIHFLPETDLYDSAGWSIACVPSSSLVVGRVASEASILCTLWFMVSYLRNFPVFQIFITEICILDQIHLVGSNKSGKSKY